MKICKKCRELKSIDEFAKHPKTRDGRQGTCRSCYRTLHSPEKARKKKLRQRYGITTEDYNLLFLKQEGRCAICKKHQSELNTRLAVDHSHKLNIVRGLLCYNCNMALGRFQDNPTILKCAYKYLLRHNA